MNNYRCHIHNKQFRNGYDLMRHLNSRYHQSIFLKQNELSEDDNNKFFRDVAFAQNYTGGYGVKAMARDIELDKQLTDIDERITIMKNRLYFNRDTLSLIYKYVPVCKL